MIPKLSQYYKESNPVSARRARFWFCFFLGLGAAFTSVFMIIHEVGHLLAAGDTLVVTLADWGYVTYKGIPTLGFMLAGWSFQLFAWLLLWGISQRLSFLFLNTLFDVVAGFSWGYVHGTVVQALRSQDFVDIEEKLGILVIDTQTNWVVYTVPIVLLCWIIVGKCLKTMD